MRVILASSSSTRRIWMSQQSWMEGHQLEIRSLAYDESVHSVEGDVFDTVREIAIGKADFAIRALADHQGGWVSVVSDTMIEDPDTGLPMGKPRDSIEAERMLRRLSEEGTLFTVARESLHQVTRWTGKCSRIDPRCFWGPCLKMTLVY